MIENFITSMGNKGKDAESCIAHHAIKDFCAMYSEFYSYEGKKYMHSHPYSYDPFMRWYNPDLKDMQDGSSQYKKVSNVYTDRLYQQDCGKYNALCKKHFGNEGQYWGDRDPKKIQEFLEDWTEKKVVLIANIQYVNVSNGNPYWRLDFYYE